MNDFLKNKKRIYFIGIGGISMSAIALFLLDKGFIVSGSDKIESDITDNLIKNGIKVNFSQAKENIDSNIDLVVYTAAISEDNEEYKKAKELNIEMMSRAELLGCIMKLYKKVINVAGTHGKTTITSMISKVLLDLNCDPTITVGAVLKYIDGNFKLGKSDYFVAEACEYKNSFLSFNPKYVIISNIEEDHLDFFKDIDDIRNSFKKYIEILDDTGILVINNNIKSIDNLVKNFDGKIITYSNEKDNASNADYIAKNINYNSNGFTYYDLYNKNDFLGKVQLKVFGEHNVENSLSVFALLLNIGFSFEDIKNSLMNFTGANRRLDFKGSFNNIKIYDDYAHHPQEIKASIKALKNLKYNNFYLVFQPHTFSRTKKLFDDFVKELSEVDNLIMVEIYAARENNIYNISSKDVIDEINNKYNKKALFYKTFEEAEEYLKSVINAEDLVVSMGAGDVYKITDNIINTLSNKK